MGGTMDSPSFHSPVAMVTAPSESCSPYPDSRSTHEAVHHSPYMQKPFFSIIIPAYNLENYIAAALQSVLVQTFQDFEIIIVDDGSSDETVSIIQSFHDPRIRLVSQVNGGVSRARNAGMKKAVGAYIAFLDGDDYWSVITAAGISSFEKANIFFPRSFNEAPIWYTSVSSTIRKRS